MSNPADNVNKVPLEISRDIQATDNNRARSAFSKIINRLNWNGTILENEVKNEKGEVVKGKYKVQVQGFEEPLDCYQTRPDDTYNKGAAVVVNIDENYSAWIVSPAFPRGAGFGLCLMIIDDLIPGTWGISLPRFGQGIGSPPF